MNLIVKLVIPFDENDNIDIISLNKLMKYLEVNSVRIILLELKSSNINHHDMNAMLKNIMHSFPNMTIFLHSLILHPNLDIMQMYFHNIIYPIKFENQEEFKLSNVCLNVINSYSKPVYIDYSNSEKQYILDNIGQYTNLAVSSNIELLEICNAINEAKKNITQYNILSMKEENCICHISMGVNYIISSCANIYPREMYECISSIKYNIYNSVKILKNMSKIISLNENDKDQFLRSALKNDGVFSSNNSLHSNI